MHKKNSTAQYITLVNASGMHLSINRKQFWSVSHSPKEHIKLLLQSNSVPSTPWQKKTNTQTPHFRTYSLHTLYIFPKLCMRI